MRVFSKSFVAFLTSVFCMASQSTAGYVEYDAAVQSLNPVAYYHLSEAEAGVPPTTSPDVALGGGVSDTATYNNFATAAYQANNVWGLLGVPDGGDRSPQFSGSTSTGSTTGTYLSIVNSADVLPKTINSVPATVLSDMSVSFFASKSDAATNRAFVLGVRNLADSTSLFSVSWEANGRFELQTRGNGAPTELIVPSITGLTDNTLYHVVFSLSLDENNNVNSVGAVYINGVNSTGTVTAVDNGTLGILAGTTDLSIGKFGSPGATDGNTGLYWNGLIDEVTFYNTALTQAQVTGLYNAALVPESSAFVLFSCGLVGLGLVSLRHRHTK